MEPERADLQAESRIACLRRTLGEFEPANPPPSRAKMPTRSDQRKQMDDTFKELTTDLSLLHKKLDTVRSCMHQMFDTLEDFEARLTALENRETNPSTYSDAVSVSRRSENRHADSERIEKLELSSSEEERRRKLLEVHLNHPSIDPTSEDLPTAVTHFLSDKLKLERREIDSNMRVLKTKRPHTVLVCLSDRKFKRFLFSAFKKYRELDASRDDKIYINDNLTTYNYNLFKTLKLERDHLRENQRQTFEAVYSYEGKNFVKKKIGDSKEDALHIRTVS